MALAVVGEALISASVETLLDRIASKELFDFFAKRKLDVSLLDELKIKLLALVTVLNDAEEKQITNLSVKKWVDELKDAVFDAEDLLDEISTDSLRCKVEGDSQTIATQVRSFLSSPYRRMNSELHAMSTRLDHFVKQKDILGLQSVTGRVSSGTITSSMVNESGVVAREDDKEKLLNMLLSDDDSNPDNIGVITILGMGGLGKTTVAQLLYNDSEVEKHFDLRAWACVSEDFNVSRVTKNLLESVTSKSHEKSENLDFLQVELRSSLKDKKFLLVLDDLWNEKYNDWDHLKTPFSSGKRGSKIIVTTRQRKVADVTHTFPIYELNHLSDESCWSIIAKIALGNEGHDKYPILEEIGRKIARKCGGLPIAAKTLGGVLRSKVDVKEWTRILKSNIWDLPNDDVLPALRISYLHLPAHLKRCFAYCSIFPKDYLLDKRELILLWMAEGFLHLSPGEKSMELAGDDCFNELLSRSLIQKESADPNEGFLMHDLICDLARVVSGKSCCCFEGNEIPNNVRHLSFLQDLYDGSEKFKGFYELPRLRTFLPQSLMPKVPFVSFSPRKVSHDLLPKLKCIRVLSLARYINTTELPNSICNLVHLRYLDLSGTQIKRLPDETFKLYNLQTLRLSGCHCLVELPSQIGNLVNLRHLDVSGSNLEEMPREISSLENLRSLTVFIVGKHEDGLRIGGLRNLPFLGGKISILKLENVADPMDALEANLKDKEQIEELEFEWSSGSDIQDSQIVKDVLDKLQPSTNIRKLNVRYYSATSFPNWVGDSSFWNITSLRINDCNYCWSVPPFGQLPSLKQLRISRMKMVQTIGQELYCNGIGSSSFQPFPVLESLKFEDMPEWQEWLAYEGEGANFPFPCLKHLHLSDCPKLKGNLPNHLPLLKEVCIQGCNLLERKSSSLNWNWNTSIQELEIGEGGEGLLSVEKCDSLQSLPRMILAANCLQHLTVSKVSLLISFPPDGLPTSLRSLTISHCDKLDFLSQETWHKYTSLERLVIWNSCPSLTSFPLGCFPALQYLRIRSCPSLESITITQGGTGGGSASDLVNLVVSDCNKLISLPRLIDLTALYELLLFRLPQLASLPQSCFPRNLRGLVVDCGILSSMAKPHLGWLRLTDLSDLHVRGGGHEHVINTLLKEQLLPTSLVQLGLEDLGCIQILPGKGLQHLTSLKELSISDCPSLECLPEDHLPSSLVELIITGCPLLEARYQSQNGKHWSKIAHIPAIWINAKPIII